MARKDPQAFWRVFKTQQHDVCPVELAAQFEAFRALMGSQPAQSPEQAELLGVGERRHTVDQYLTASSPCTPTTAQL
ncbi:hypothetical protein ABBQ32_001518 [Trebouxia sp. C0010 RCD-2024]